MPCVTFVCFPTIAIVLVFTSCLQALLSFVIWVLIPRYRLRLTLQPKSTYTSAFLMVVRMRLQETCEAVQERLEIVWTISFSWRCD